MENPYIKNPISVAIYNPVKNLNSRIYCFLGKVPAAIITAATRYHSATGATQAKYQIQLKEFYGASWKSKLHLGIKDYTRALLTEPIETVGAGRTRADEFAREKSKRYLGGEEIDFSNIEDLLKETSPAEKPVASETGSSIEYSATPGLTFITSVHIFPEDTLTELKEKIYLAIGIPTYRQHLFGVVDGVATTSYNLYAEGSYETDIRKINRFRDKMFEIPIDKNLYTVRDSIRVEAYDDMTILDNFEFNDFVVVSDLALFTNRVRSQLLDTIKDTYSFELFYYGFVIKYFPQLTRECFYDFVVDEKQLQSKYPDLAKSKRTLESRYDAEAKIVNRNWQTAARARGLVESGAATMGITALTAVVDTTGVLLNIRNLFDLLRVSKCIPEIHAYQEYNNVKYLFRKRFTRNESDIIFPSSATMKTGITIAISIKKTDQQYFHKRAGISTVDNEQNRYLFLNIRGNGRYYVKSFWNEEDEFGFADILRIMKAFIIPILESINRMDKYVFASGVSLRLLSASNIKYQGLNVSVFWKKVIPGSTFKLVRAAWEPYFTAGIISPRNVKQFDNYEFTFRKGMHQFDITTIERVVTLSNNMVLSNYYEYLSNNTVRQKWEQNYGGRVMKMAHRTTDIKFEITDIQSEEFRIFYFYILGFIYSVCNDPRIKESTKIIPNYANVKRLKKLKEQDPELYNLKKHGSKKVYSIKCQNKRQPLIYTNDEIAKLSEGAKRKLTKYWNFTNKAPAYYSCPNKEYPHFGFLTGIHPRDYCLPCCNKKEQSDEDSRRAKMNAICLRDHKFTDKQITEDSASRHIMNYGKDIDLGRISKLPPSSMKNLLLNALGEEHVNFYLFGVAQHVPAVENCGLVFALAESIGVSPRSMIETIISELKKTKSQEIFNTLLGGILAEYFETHENMLWVIKELFLDMKMFSNEIKKFTKWNELFMELAHLVFDISTFILLDSSTGSAKSISIDLYVSDKLQRQIVYLSRLDSKQRPQEFSPANQSYAVVIKKRNKYYPIFAIDLVEYFKSFEIKQKMYSWDSAITKLFSSMVLFNEQRTASGINKKPDLYLVKEITTGTDYSIKTKYINKSNRCYACLLQIEDDFVYVPIEYSVYLSDGIPIEFSAFDPEIEIKFTAVNEWFDVCNNWILKYHSTPGDSVQTYYQLQKPTAWIHENGTPVGISTGDNYIYWFNKYSPEDLVEDIPIANTKYSFPKINSAIISREPPATDPRTELLGEAMYNNYLYQLFVVEFINWVGSETNTNMRNTILGILKSSNLRKNYPETTAELKKKLSNYPEDYNLISRAIMSYLYAESISKQQFLEDIMKVRYRFDKITINRLAEMSEESARKYIKNIADKFLIQKQFDTSKIKFPNIYMPCSIQTTQSGYCEQNKLIVNKPIEDLVDILVKDLSNNLKREYLLSDIWMDLITNNFQFIQRECEIITIYRM